MKISFTFVDKFTGIIKIISSVSFFKPSSIVH